MLFWIKKRLIYFKLQRNGNENCLTNIKDSSTERFQLQMVVLHQTMGISKTGHSSLRHVWKEYKDKTPDVLHFHRNIGVSCNSKLSLPKYKDLCIKSTEKVLKDEWMYVANTEILKLKNVSRNFQLNEILLPVLNIFIVDTEEYSLGFNNRINDAKPLNSS